MSDEIRAQVSAVVDALLGSDERTGKLADAVREQIEPQIAQRLEPLQGSIEAIKEKLAEGPPAPAIPRYQPAPWSNSGMVAAALGLPDANWHNPEAPGAKLDGKFESFGEYLRALIRHGRGGPKDDRLSYVPVSGPRAALTGEEIDLGGALVPEEYRPQLLTMMLQMTSIRSRATVLPMGASSLQIPAIRDATHADRKVFGGVAFNWLEVNNEIADSEPDFKLVTLNARALAGRTSIPNTLIEDSFITVPMLVMQLWQQAVPWIEEYEFIRGDGVGKPLGILNSDALVTVTRDTASTFKVADMFEMESRLPPGSQSRAVWMMHPQVLPQLGTLNQGDVQSWHPSLAADMPGTLNGRPVIFNEHMSGLGAEGDVALVDWMYYVIGDRQALSMMASQHEDFSRNRTVLRGIERIDGTPWLDTPIIPSQRTGTTYQMSPFVALN